MGPKKPWKQWQPDTVVKTHGGSYANKTAGDGAEGEEESGSRARKRKVGLTVGYCGTGFQGMQMNEGVRTIEAELEHALYRAGLISSSNFGNLTKVAWSRAARTDKGVHAAAQVVGCKLCIDEGGEEGEGKKEKEEGEAQGGGAAETDKATAMDVGNGEEAVVNGSTGCGTAEAAAPPPPGLAGGGGGGGDLASLVEAVNVHLPPSIRVLDMVRVTKPFDARKHCDKRRYVYLLPTFVLMDRDEANAIVSQCAGVAPTPPPPLEGEGGGAALVITPPLQGEGEGGGGQGGGEEGQGDDQVDAAAPAAAARGGGGVQEVAADDGEEEEDGSGRPSSAAYTAPDEAKLSAAFEQQLRGFRVSAERVARFRSVLRLFEGNKRFHNFTTRMDPRSSQAWRMLVSVTASDPFVEGGVEWMAVTLEGLSFLLYMIRKIVATAVDVSRGSADDATMLKAFEVDIKMLLPLAPPDGLYLQKASFDAYNQRLEKGRARLDWEEDEAAVARVKAFEKEHIVSHIINKEMESLAFARWLYNLSHMDKDAYVAKPHPLNKKGHQANYQGGGGGGWGKKRQKIDDAAEE